MAELISNNKNASVSVSSNNLKYYSDTAKNYRDEAAAQAKLAKDWAVKTDGTVDDVEYSSKYYANMTGSIAQNALNDISRTKNEAISDIVLEKQNTETTINTELDSAVQALENSKNELIEEAELTLNEKTAALQDSLTTHKNELALEIELQAECAVTAINSAGLTHEQNAAAQAEIAEEKALEAAAHAINAKNYSDSTTAAAENAVNNINAEKTAAINQISELQSSTLEELGNKGLETLGTIDAKKEEALDAIQGKIEPSLATSDSAGVVKPDNQTIIIDEDGTLHAALNGGTNDYNALVNIPSINGVELSGNKTSGDLGINSASWGNITGTITEQQDLVNLIEENIGGAAAFDSLPLFYNFYSQENFNSLMYKKSDGNFLNGVTYSAAYNNLIQRLGNDDNVKEYGDETITEYDFVVNQADITFRLPLTSGRVLVEKIVHGKEDNYRWAELYSDGKLIQGGFADAMSSQQAITVEFLKSYSYEESPALSVNIAINRTAQSTTSNEVRALTRGCSNTGFTIYKYSTTSTGFNWRVEGYTEPPVNTGWNLYYKLGNSVENLNVINAQNALDEIKAEVEAGLSGKQDVLTFDNTPRENSANPVTSDGVYKALQNIGGAAEQPDNLVTIDTNQEISGNKTFSGMLNVKNNGTMPGIVLSCENFSDGYIRARNTDIQFMPMQPDYLEQTYYLQFDGVSGGLCIIKNFDDYSVVVDIAEVCKQVGNVSSVLDAINGEVV